MCAYKNRGICYSFLENYALAEKDFSQAISLKSDDKYLYVYRAYCRGEQGDYFEALIDLNTAFEKDANFSEAYLTLGLIKLWLDDYDGAQKEFTIAIKLDPKNGRSYYNRGIAKERTGDIGGACFDFEKSEKLGYPKASSMISEFCE